MPLSNILLGPLALLTAAIIWGLAFVAQRVGAESVPALAFNGIRLTLGVLSLLPLLLLRKRIWQGCWWPGLVLGLVLCLGANLQQYAMSWVSAGKSAFLTGLYLVFVPLMLCLHRRQLPLPPLLIAGVALVGLFLLSVEGGFTLAQGDAWVVICAVFFALHVILIDHYARRHDNIVLAAIQFAVAAIISLVLSWNFESTSLSAIEEIWWPLLYAGIGSIGIAYTLQIVGQSRTSATSAAMILAMESVFGALGGYWLLHESMSERQLIGCGLMLLAMLVGQLPKFRID